MGYVETFGATIHDALSLCALDERALVEEPDGEVVGGLTATRIQTWIKSRASRIGAVLEAKCIDPKLVTDADYPGARELLIELIAFGVAANILFAKGQAELASDMRTEWANGMRDLRERGLHTIGHAIDAVPEELEDVPIPRLRRG